MRVIYAVTGIPEWVEVARMLHDEHQWEPIYWLTTPENHSAVIHQFPETIAHRYHEAVRGVPPEGRQFRSIGLDEPTIRRFMGCQCAVMKMMDRMDPGGCFTYSERARHYHRLLMYWLQVVPELRPDLAVFASSPHLITDYVLYSVLVDFGVATAVFTPTTLPDTTLIRGGLDEYPQTGVDEGSHILTAVDGSSAAHSRVVAEYVARIRSDYSVAEPDYMRRQREAVRPANRPPLRSRLLRALVQPWRWPAHARNVLLAATRASVEPESPPSYHKVSGARPESDYLRGRAWYQQRETARGYLDRLRSAYERLAQPVDLAAPFVYVPLHYQPERTTSPEAGVFVDQYLMVGLLSECLPEGWGLYVKEHPSQFSSVMHGEKGRSEDLYLDLSQLAGVTLVPLTTSVNVPGSGVRRPGRLT